MCYTCIVAIMNNLFTGRIARLNYFLDEVVLYIAVLIFSIIVWHLGLRLIGTLLILIAYIACIFFLLSLTIRRLHDLNWSGWLSLLFLIPLVNLVLALILLFKRGTEWNNKYGSEPKTGIDIFGTLWSSKQEIITNTSTTSTTTPHNV